MEDPGLGFYVFVFWHVYFAHDVKLQRPDEDTLFLVSKWVEFVNRDYQKRK